AERAAESWGSPATGPSEPDVVEPESAACEADGAGPEDDGDRYREARVEQLVRPGVACGEDGERHGRDREQPDGQRADRAAVAGGAGTRDGVGCHDPLLLAVRPA